MNDDSGFQPNWQTTRWSIVLNSKKSNESPESLAASLQSLCEFYWYPLYVYLRRKGYAPEDCQDLTQDFFASLIEKDFLKVVDPNKGRFRWFLMHAVRKFAASWTAGQAALKRGGGRKFFSLEFEKGEARYSHEPTQNATPESLFDRQWALTILSKAIERIEQTYHEDGKQRYFDALRTFISPGTNVDSYAEVGQKLGLSETAIKVAIHRLRQKYKQVLREIVLETLDDPSDLDAEIESLMSALS